MSEAIHGKTLQSNSCQILTKLETDKSVKVLGPKWHVEEIQVCKHLLQGKCLMLGGAKKSIVVVIVNNDEAIAIERSFITLRDFHTIHAEVVCQLALVENLLKIVIRLRNQSFTIGLLKDYEEFVCEMNDITHVQVQSEMTLQGVNLGLGLSIFECL
jgi:hypothetical protein